MADLKEVHFFDNDSLDWSDPTCLSFHEHFEWSQTSGMIRGEATPIYGGFAKWIKPDGDPW
jgi:hypothetical protein